MPLPNTPYILSANAWEFITGANYAAMRESLGVGLTDSPEFANLTLTSPSLVSSAPVTISQTWNNAAVTFTGLKVNAAGTSGTNSAAGSVLLDLQVGGATKVSVNKDGSIGGYGYNGLNTSGVGTMQIASGNATFGYHMARDYCVTWGGAATLNGSIEVSLCRDGAANTLALRNGAGVPQAFRVYNTFLGTTANEWFEIDWKTTAGLLKIGTTSGGTGVGRPIELNASGNYINFNIGTIVKFAVASTSNLSYQDFKFNSHNSHDIGASGANSPRNIYVASNIYAAGNVGIGTTNPVADLDIAETWNAPAINVTGASGASGTATITFATQAAAIPVGMTVVVAGINPSGYNGTYVVTASSVTSVSYANATTATYISSGTVQRQFTAMKLNVTDTASDAFSKLLDLQVGGVSQLTLRKNGIVFGSGVYGTPKLNGIDGGNSFFINPFSGNIGLSDTTSIQWGSSSAPYNNQGDTFIKRGGIANLHLGDIDAAAPVAQTLSVQSVVAGTTNTAGVDFTIDGSQGTGTGAGGNLVFRTAPASGSSGSTQNALSTALVLTPTRHLLIGNLSAGFSNTGLLAMGLALGTSGGNTGNVAGEQIIMYSSQAKVGEYVFGTRLKNNSSWQLEWSSTNAATGTTDTIISRGQDVANIQLGAADAATAVAQTLSVQSVIAGTLNTAGANFTIDGSQGTGTGSGGSILFRTAPASGSSGSTQNPFATALTITQAGNVGIGTTAPGAKLQVSYANQVLTGNVTDLDVSAKHHIAAYTPDTAGINVGASLGLGGCYFNNANYITFGAIAGRKELATNNNAQGYLSFLTASNGSGLIERMRIDSVGNVGIGTTAPASALHISGALGVNNTTYDSAAALKLTNTSGSPIISWLLTAGIVGVANNTFSIRQDSTALPALTITSTTNNVGIGTTAPGAKLTVITPFNNYPTDKNPVISLRQSTDNTFGFDWIQDGQNTGDLHLHRVNGGVSTHVLAITRSAGNVGIGINAPTSKLHVAGTIKPEQATITTNATTAITLDISHAGTVLTTSSSSGVTITLPAAGTVGVGYNVMIIQGASGTITVQSGAGNTLNSFGNLYTSAGLHAAICIVCTAANTYNISGNLA